GVSLFTPERFSKQFELLSELVPEAKVIALLAIPNILPTLNPAVREIEEMAGRKAVRIQILSAVTDSALDAASATLGQLRGGAGRRGHGVAGRRRTGRGRGTGGRGRHARRRFAAGACEGEHERPRCRGGSGRPAACWEDDQGRRVRPLPHCGSADRRGARIRR